MRKLVSPLVNWIFHISIFLFLFSNKEGSAYFENKINDFLFTGVIILSSAFLNFIPKFYKRPVKMNVKQLNKVTRKTSCEYVQNNTGMDGRTIELIIESKRSNGWNSLLYWYLKKKEFFILIECNPKEIHLQAKDESLKPNEIIPLMDGSGFMINISNYVKEISKHRNEGTLAKKVQFFIKDPRNVSTFYLDDDTSVFINPILILNKDSKKRAKLIEFMLNWSPQDYKIEYYRNEGSKYV